MKDDDNDTEDTSRRADNGRRGPTTITMADDNGEGNSSMTNEDDANDEISRRC